MKYRRTGCCCSYGNECYSDGNIFRIPDPPPLTVAKVRWVGDAGHTETRPRRSRSRTSSNPESLVVAARDLFAAVGPGAVSIRAVAEAAGCSHTLVGRHFGSKAGLETAVIERLAIGVGVLVARQCSDSDWSVATVLQAMRDHPSAAKLILRAGLGEFDVTPLATGHNLALCLAERIEERRGGDPRSPSPTAMTSAYIALSIVFGYLALEDFIVHASRSVDVPRDVRDAAIADAAQMIVEHGSDPKFELTWDEHTSTTVTDPAALISGETGEEALVRAAVDLYAERGPGNVTTRDVADRAGVNQGLIYHYFPSREALIARAIEAANRPFARAMLPEGRVDLEPLIRLRPDLKALVIMARYLLDGGQILDVRREFPVLDAVLSRYPSIPEGPGRGTLADPRLAAAAAAMSYQSTAITDRALRQMLGIPTDVDLGSAHIWAVELLLSQAD